MDKSMVCWTRKCRAHRIALKHAHGPGYVEAMGQLAPQLQEYVAGIGNVSWIAGGEWNLELG